METEGPLENSASVMAVWAEPEEQQGLVFAVRPRRFVDALHGSPPPSGPWGMFTAFVVSFLIVMQIEGRRMYSVSGLIVLGIVGLLLVGAFLLLSVVRKRQERDAEERGR